MTKHEEVSCLPNRQVRDVGCVSGARIGGHVDLVLVLVLAAGVIGGSIGFWMGLSRGEALSASQAGELADLRIKTRELTSLRSELLGRIVMLEREMEVDGRTMEDLRAIVEESEARILQCNKDLAFYKHVVSPGKVQNGLGVMDFELLSAGNGGQFHYKVILMQKRKGRKLVKGNLRISVSGEVRGVPKTLSRKELGEKTSPGFAFKYFQVVEGDILLPPDFQPRVLTISIVPKTKGLKKIENTYPWLVS